MRRWIKSGCRALDDQRPTLILGEDLLEFLARSKAPKQRCQPHECYCVKCRAPRAPAGRMAEFVELTSTTGNLQAICPICDNLMHKRVCEAALVELGAKLDLTIAQASPSLKD